jgi:hypothetical protein
MAGYLDLMGFKAISTMPDEYVDEVEVRYPGWIANQLDYWSRWIDTLLRKRYAAPFVAPYPVTILNWLERIVVAQVHLKRGVNANDEQVATIIEDSKSARAEVLAAANPENALAELPTIAGASTTGVTKGAPLGYSEISPYTWTQRQLDGLPE